MDPRCKHEEYYWHQLVERVNKNIFEGKDCCRCKGKGRYVYDCLDCGGSGSVRSYIDTPQLSSAILDEDGYTGDGYYSIRCLNCKGDKKVLQNCYQCRRKHRGKHDIVHKFLDGSLSCECKRCLKKKAIPAIQRYHKEDHRQGLFVMCQVCHINFEKDKQGFRKGRCYHCRKQNGCIIC